MSADLAYRPYRPRRRLKRSWKIGLTVLGTISGLCLTVIAVMTVRQLMAPVPGDGVEPPDWVEQNLLPLNPYSRPGDPLRRISGVVIHYVGNPGTSAAANRSYFANLAKTEETYASAHFIVGLEGEAVQCVPLSEIAYCSNRRNEDTVSIEVCHPDESGLFLPQTMDRVVELTAWLCARFGLDTSQVIRHYDVSGKRCPLYYVEHEDAWQALLARVEAAIPAFAEETEP